MKRTLLILSGAALLALVSCNGFPERQADIENTPDSVAEETSPKLTPLEADAPTANVPSEMDATIYGSRSNAITRTVQQVSPAVVSITVTEVVQGTPRVAFDDYYGWFLAPGEEREFNSMGSGFIISEDGHVVTNQHVVGQNSRRIVVSLPDGSQHEAQLLGSDELADLSLLKIQSDTTFPYIEFGDSDNVQVGEWSLAVGNPFGLFDAAQPSVTVGVVSATRRDFRPNPNEPRVYMDMIQTDAAINRGNSGGPLVNAQGEVIGINTFIYTGGTSYGNVGLGFAIPSNRVQKIISQLVETGQVQMSYDPGLETTPMTYTLAAQYGLPQIMGLLVTSVNMDGPASEAGVMPGDIILVIGDERVHSPMHAQALMREYEAGDTMRVELIRENRRYEAMMTLRGKVEVSPAEEPEAAE